MDSQDIKNILGTSLREIRIAKGLTQEQLAELIDKDYSTINRIETGKNFVNSQTFAKLCDVLNVPPALLFTAKPQILLKERVDYTNEIMQLLQTFPQENLKDAYKLLFLLNKYFT